jgi:hypothetical protein
MLNTPGRFQKWYPGQHEAFDHVQEWMEAPGRRFLGLSLPTGCHAPGTRVVMYDLTTKTVEDVQVGDRLMGPDGDSRQVLQLCQGREMMYRITPLRGTPPFVVNENHVLSLVSTCEGEKEYPCQQQGGELTQITVGDYLKKAKYWKHLRKLYRSGPVGQHIPDIPYRVEPWVLGVILGDGCTLNGSISVCNPDTEIIDGIGKFAGDHGCTVRVGTMPGNAAVNLYIVKSENRHNHMYHNSVMESIRSLGLADRGSGNKFVPDIYKQGSVKTRLEILAGLLDSDGHHDGKGGYDFISKSKQLAEDVVFISRSLGITAHQRLSHKTCQTGAGGLYHRVFLSGDTSGIPCRVERKKPTTRKQKKDGRRTGFSVEPAGVGDFYGFVLSGDHLYLTDDFVVHHNSGKTVISMLSAAVSGKKTVILTATKGLQSQIVGDFAEVGIVDIRGRNNYPCLLVDQCTAEDGPCTSGIHCGVRNVCPYQEQLQRAKEADIVVTNYSYYLAQCQYADGLGDTELLICDESHLAFNALESYLSTYIGKDDIETIGSSFPAAEDVSKDFSWDQWVQWAQKAIPAAEAYALKVQMQVQMGGIDASLLRVGKKAKALLHSLQQIAESATVGPWVAVRKAHGWEFRPVWVAGYSKLLFGDTGKVMLMSALLSGKMMDTVGVPMSERELYHAESAYPAANTPVYHVQTVRLNHRSTKIDVDTWINRIDQIINKRLDRKGIIFTVSYDRANLLIARSQHQRIMMTHRTYDVAKIVSEFKGAEAPAVLVSPSVTTGYDFPATEFNCKYIIIGKLMWPDTSDPAMQSRQEDDADWGAYCTMNSIVQASGRMTRSATDRAEVIIVDDNWMWFWYKYRHFSPRWFQQRVIRGKDTVPDPMV